MIVLMHRMDIFNSIYHVNWVVFADEWIVLIIANIKDTDQIFGRSLSEFLLECDHQL